MDYRHITEAAELQEEVESDFFGLLKAKERLGKENSELLLEVHRLKAQLIQAQGLEEKVSRLERQEAGLKAEIERLQVDHEASEQRAEEERLRASSFSEQLSVAKAREEELLKQELAKTKEFRERVEQAKVDDVKLLALKAKLAAQEEQCQEAIDKLEKAEKVRMDLMRVLQERNGEIEKLRQELKELSEYERSKTAQVVELTKSAAVLEERGAALTKELQEQESATKKAQEDAEETREALAKSKDEAKVLQSRINDLEANVEQLQKEVTAIARLREDLARAESLASEREAALRAAQRREEQLNEQVTQQQSRADTAQASLLSEKSSVQRLESDLQAARAAQASARAELERVICQEEASRAELLQRADKKAAAEAMRLSAEIERLEEQLQQLTQQLGQKHRASAEMEVQLSKAGSRQAAMEVALQEAHRSKEEAHAAHADAFRRLQELSHSDKAVATSRRRFIERGASLGTRHGRAAQDDRAATRRGDQGPPSEPLAVPGRRLVLQGGLVESSSTLASSSKSDLLQEPIATEPIVMEPRQERQRVRAESREPAEPQMHSAGSEEPRSYEALQKHPGAERPSDIVAGLAPKDPLPPDAELPLPPAARMQEPPESTAPEMPAMAPAPIQEASTLSVSRPRIQASSLAAWHRHLSGLERMQLLSVVWRLWAGPAKVSALRARLELILLDEFRLAKAREEVQRELKEFLQPRLRSPELWPPVFGGPVPGDACETSDGQIEAGSLERKLSVMKSFVLEFRKRVAEAVAELPGALNDFAEGQAFQTTLEIGRGSFGRLLHASLFLYQKLRTLVPSELEETMRDPVSRLVPVPFYVLPYKFRLAVHRGVGGLAQGIAAPRKGSCPRAHLQELQDMMPLCTSDGAVPNFLVRLLAVRGAEASPASSEPATEAAAAAAQSGVRDGLDQLVVDALTVYMSGWRMCNGGSAKMEETEPVSMLAASRQILERRGRSPAAVGRPQPRQKQGHDLLQEPKLRLGPDRSF